MHTRCTNGLCSFPATCARLAGCISEAQGIHIYSLILGHCFPMSSNPVVENTARALRTNTASDESRDLAHKTTAVISAIKTTRTLYFLAGTLKNPSHPIAVPNINGPYMSMFLGQNIRNFILYMHAQHATAKQYLSNIS